jgi:hypothetical protein
MDRDKMQTTAAVAEEDIRVAAYHIWNDEGQPEGKANEHWARAREHLETENAGTAASRPKAKKAKSPAKAAKSPAKAAKPKAKK